MKRHKEAMQSSSEDYGHLLEGSAQTVQLGVSSVVRTIPRKHLDGAKVRGMLGGCLNIDSFRLFPYLSISFHIFSYLFISF